MDRSLILFIVISIIVCLLNQGCDEGTHAESVYHGRSVSTVCVP
jgi:hypothetical protein